MTSTHPRPAALHQLADHFVAALCRQSPGAARYRRDDRLDLLAWGRRHLPAHFRCQPSAMHGWLAVQLDRIGGARGGRVNVLAPRGSAKSTVGTLAYVLEAALAGGEPYIWIVSATKSQAATHLANVKAELESNERLSRAFPNAVGRGALWRSTAIRLANGAVIESYGTGQQLRGRRRGAHRPTLIVCDDIENDRHVESPQQRSACREWFHGVLLKAGDERTNVVNLATALHRDALAMHLHRAAGWTSRLFRAIERWPADLALWQQWEELYRDASHPTPAVAARDFFERHAAEMRAGAELLWPAKESLYALMRMRVDEGRTAFEREKQNSPIDPERCEWPAEYFGDHIWFDEWPRRLTSRALALDPSKGADARHGDYSALVYVGVGEQNVIYVDADLARRPTPQIVADAVGLCEQFHPEAFGVEANQFQELLAGEIAAALDKSRQLLVRPEPIDNFTSKRVRIRRLGPLLSQRRLRFNARSASTRLLVDQLRDFPLGDHDDGPDALEMALRLAARLRESAPDDGLGDNLLRRR
jgi:predicted phage terminase large subunit-like protein